MDLEHVRHQLDELLEAACTETDDATADAVRLGEMIAMLASARERVIAERYRAVMRMRDEGHSLGSIGALLGISRGTAQGLVERARSALDQPG